MHIKSVNTNVTSQCHNSKNINHTSLNLRKSRVLSFKLLHSAFKTASNIPTAFMFFILPTYMDSTVYVNHKHLPMTKHSRLVFVYSKRSQYLLQKIVHQGLLMKFFVAYQVACYLLVQTNKHLRKIQIKHEATKH